MGPGRTRLGMNMPDGHCKRTGLGRRSLRQSRMRWYGRDAQSTEKSVFYGFLSLDSVYGFFLIYGRIYGFFLTRFGYYPLPPTPLHCQDSRYSTGIFFIFGRIYRFFLTRYGYYAPPPDPISRARRVNFFGYYPKS